MSYTPINQNVYGSAFFGAYIGMALDGKNPTSVTPSDYSGSAQVAGAFAAQLDTTFALSGAQLTALGQSALLGACQAIWSSRTPVNNPSATALMPSTYAPQVNALIEGFLNEAGAYFVSQGITNPITGAGGVLGSYANPSALTASQAASIVSNDTVGLAVANVATGLAVGFVAQTSGTNALVMTQGELGGFTGLTAGGLVYLSPTVAGSVTQTKPTTPGQIVQVLGIAKDATTIAVNVEDDFIQL